MRRDSNIQVTARYNQHDERWNVKIEITCNDGRQKYWFEQPVKESEHASEEVLKQKAIKQLAVELPKMTEALVSHLPPNL